jgi:hypothetical protein
LAGWRPGRPAVFGLAGVFERDGGDPRLELAEHAEEFSLILGRKRLHHLLLDQVEAAL